MKEKIKQSMFIAIYIYIYIEKIITLFNTCIYIIFKIIPVIKSSCVFYIYVLQIYTVFILYKTVDYPDKVT